MKVRLTSVALTLLLTSAHVARADDSLQNQPAPKAADELPSILDLGAEEHVQRIVPWQKFLEESSVKLRLRNYYLNRHKPEATDPSAWAQGGSIEYTTGKVGGVFSGTLEYFGSFRLWAPDNHDGTLLLQEGQNNIDILGVANAKFDLDGHILSVYRQKYDLPYLNSQDNRMIPNTFEGYTIAMPKTSNDNFQYVIGYIDSMKKRNSQTFVSMSDAAGVRSGENGVLLGGLRFFPVRDLSIGVINLYTNDIFNMAYAEAVYKQKFSDDMSNNLSVQYSDQHSVGEDLLRGGDSFSSNFWGIQEAFSYRHAIIKAAFNQTDTGADMRSPYGSYPGYTSSIVEDFNRAGETSWLIGVSYDFGRLGLKDLSLSTNYISGSGAINELTKEDVNDKRETDVTLDYKVSAGFLKGFWLRLRSATIQEDNRPQTQDWRVILNYEIPLYSPLANS